MEYQMLLYHKESSVAKITLNRPAVLNAINRKLQDEWLAALEEAERDVEVRAVIIRGMGRAFSAGHDLKENLTQPNVGPEGWRTALRRSMALALKIWELPKPVLAAVNGYCLGEANQILQACDIIIASEDAVFGDPEVRFVASSSFPILPWMIRLRKAKELMLTGNTINASEAERIGLVNKVVPPDRLEEETLKFAKRLCEVPAVAILLNKRSANRNLEVAGFLGALRSNLEYVSAITAISAEEQEHAQFMRMAREQGFRAAFHKEDAQRDES